jgi:hypothetical protein
MRMEEWRQIGGGLQTIRKMRMDARQHWKWNQAGNTETLACHFLPRYYMDLGHPSRLPYGSLRSAWTGPGRDPTRITDTRKWQALSWRYCSASRWSVPNILPITIK